LNKRPLNDARNIVKEGSKLPGTSKELKLKKFYELYGKPGEIASPPTGGSQLFHAFIMEKRRYVNLVTNQNNTILIRNT
jgi:hypothetical protein